jgi:D-inositol-3-phosphate glycosyltransferase
VGDFPSTYSEGLHGVVARLGLEERIRMIPLTTDVDDWYAAADAFVLASDVESLPRSMMEAMAHGLAVIAPGVFGIPELIEDGRSGYLFEPSSLSALEDAMRRYLRASSEERRAVARSGQEIVVTTRSSETYAREYAALIAELSSEAAGR